ncbi:MAG: hypothetical protein K2P68_09355 [Sphingomonas sp.]|nr:hypothetical protein [Sphingomonas sp.]
MQVFEMVVMIVAIVTVGRIIRLRYETKNSAAGMDAAPVGDARRLRDEVTMLKERIAVLERLATDDNNAVRLDREIEKLRDPH